MFDRISGASRRPDLDGSDDDGAADTARHESSPAVAYVGSAVDARIDAGLADFVRNASKGPPPNDEILHIGMNRSSAPAEEAKLSKLAKITEIAHSERAGIISIDGKSYDLVKPDGRGAFVGLLHARGMSEMQAQLVVAAIAQTNPTGADEMAHLALLWAKGEAGGTVPSRIVPSTRLD